MNHFKKSISWALIWIMMHVHCAVACVSNDAVPLTFCQVAKSGRLLNRRTFWGVSMVRTLQFSGCYITSVAMASHSLFIWVPIASVSAFYCSLGLCADNVFFSMNGKNAETGGKHNPRRDFQWWSMVLQQQRLKLQSGAQGATEFKSPPSLHSTELVSLQGITPSMK